MDRKRGGDDGGTAWEEISELNQCSDMGVRDSGWGYDIAPFGMGMCFYVDSAPRNFVNFPV